MPAIVLPGFPDKPAGEMAATLEVEGFSVTCEMNTGSIQREIEAAFMWCETTGLPRRRWIVKRWLDALDAGANDYCCVPLDTRQCAWVLRLGSHAESRILAQAAGA